MPGPGRLPGVIPYIVFSGRRSSRTVQLSLDAAGIRTATLQDNGTKPNRFAETVAAFRTLTKSNRAISSTNNHKTIPCDSIILVYFPIRTKPCESKSFLAGLHGLIANDTSNYHERIKVKRLCWIMVGFTPSGDYFRLQSRPRAKHHHVNFE
jgi:hypothetical protein